MILRLDREQQNATSVWSRVSPGASRILSLLLVLLLPMLLAADLITHKVVKDDTLYSLSKKYGVSVDQIRELNGLADNMIHLGQVLKIKDDTAATPKPPTIPPAVTPPPATNPTPPTPSTPPPVVSTPPVVTPPAATVSTPGQTLAEDFYYTVQKQDNLYRIAVNHNVKLPDLLLWNGFANENQLIHPGDRVIIKDPSTFNGEGVSTNTTPQVQSGGSVTAPADSVVVEKVYFVQKKDTLYSIAKANGMTVDELKKLNNLEGNDIKIGQKIYLAGDPAKIAAQTSAKILTEEEIQKSDKIRGDLIMPTNGKVTSEFGIRGGRPHKGIDIGAKSGTPVYAALAGVVVYSGVQGGYGNVVVIEHPDFVMTVYAHNEMNLVKVNDRVSQGQLIAYVGSTGNSTGPHLHFEYRLKGKAINPRKVLPL